MSRRAKLLLILLAAYALVLAGTVGGLVWLRDWTLTTMADNDWQEWKEKVAEDKAKRQQGEYSGPVDRRIPKSNEPPALVLMRDRFGPIVGASLGCVTVLFAVLVIFARSTLRSEPSESATSVQANSPAHSGTLNGSPRDYNRG